MNRLLCVRAVVAALTSLAALMLSGCDESPRSNDPPMTPAFTAALNEGAALMGQFEFEKASGAFAAALAIDPNNLYAQLGAAIAQLNQTSDDAQQRAITMFAPLMSDPMVGIRATYGTALGQLFLGQSADALKNFQRVALADPQDVHAAYYSAQCLEMAGDLSAALAQYERSVALDPYLRSAVLGVQRIAARLDQPERAAEMLALFDRLAPNPRSTLAQFKYSRMGALGEVFLPAHRAREFARESSMDAPGPLFAPATKLNIKNLPPDFKSDGCHSTIDLNGDGRTDLICKGQTSTFASMLPIFATPAPQGGRAGWRAAPDHPIAKIANVSAIMWGDVNNDGLIDGIISVGRTSVSTPEQDAKLFYWLEQSRDGPWTPRYFGAEVQGEQRALAIADLDHDGDLDVLITDQDSTGQSRLRILYNRFDGSAQSWQAQELPVESAQWVASAVIIDIDGDGDLDVVACTLPRGSSNAADKTAAVFLNDRLWAWSRDSKKYGEFEEIGATTAVGYLRDEDGIPMIAALTRSDFSLMNSSDVVVYAFEPAGPRLVFRTPAGIAQWIAVVDVAGDGCKNILVGGVYRRGWIDSMVEGDEGSTSGVAMFDQSGTFVEKFTLPGDSPYSPAVPIILRESGLALISGSFYIRGAGSGRKPIATIDFRGRVDPAQQMRTNASGIGTTATARIGGHWETARQLPWMSGGLSSAGQSTDPCIIGLGSGGRTDAPTAATIDFLSIDWPDGVTQTERALTPTAHTIVETQRQISSCPVIFTWNGVRMQFVTDSLGVGGLGFLAAITQDAQGRLSPVYAPPRPWERIAIAASALAPTSDERGSHYEIALTEPMEELTALDSASLKAYDLPAGWSMALDERMGISDPQPTGAAIFYRDEMLPTSATVIHGSRAPIDQTSAVRERDFVAVDPGTIDSRFIGRTAQPFSLELTFARPIAHGEGDPILLMDGWIEYPYCQTVFAMWQASATLSAPTFEALDPATGAWVTIVKEYGYPAGMPREAAFPLDPARLPAQCTTLRISTTHELYIDRCRVIWSEPCAEAVEHTLPLQQAHVIQSGFAARRPAAQRRPIYDYEARRPLWDCRVQPGYYTTTQRDCSPLLTSVDDAVAIFAGGEEVRLRFDARLAPLAAGWSRGFVLDLNGWCKDMDFLTGGGARVDPLPLRDSESSPSPAREALHAEFNTRYEGGR